MISLENVSFGFSKHSYLISSLSFEISSGDLVAVVGPNGSGKSTLLKLIMGELKASRGSIFYGPDISSNISFLTSVAAVERDFPMSVYDFIRIGLFEASPVWGQLKSDQIEQCFIIIKKFGIGHLLKENLSTLSKGEFQRIQLARISLENRRVILLDEPFLGLDAANAKILIDLLQEWSVHGKSVVCALHDFAKLKKIFQKTVFLSKSYQAVGPTNFVLGNAPEFLEW